MTYREYMDEHRDENMSWCKPYVSDSGSVCVAVTVLDGGISQILIDGEETAVTADNIQSTAKLVNDDYDLYSGWSDTHILLDGNISERGCAECPYNAFCQQMDEEMDGDD